MNTTYEAAMIDRQALAEQVIISAGNVLAAAGFGRTEIADFFMQAAEKLGAAREGSGLSVGRLAEVATKFSQIPAVQDLHNLGVEAQALIPLEAGPADLRDLFDMAMQAVPMLAESQQGLRTLASEAMLTLVAHRTGRDSKSADPETEHIICLEDFEALYQGAFDLLGAVAEALVKRQDRDAFTFLLGHLADNGVILNPALQATLEKGLNSLES